MSGLVEAMVITDYPLDCRSKITWGYYYSQGYVTSATYGNYTIPYTGYYLFLRNHYEYNIVHGSWPYNCPSEEYWGMTHTYCAQTYTDETIPLGSYYNYKHIADTPLVTYTSRDYPKCVGTTGSWHTEYSYSVYYLCGINTKTEPCADEYCNGVDDNNNDQIDEGIDPPLNDKQKGVCKDSKKKCGGASGWINDYSGIAGYEETETTCDGKDNDCDGLTDEDLDAPLNDAQYGVCYGSKKKCGGKNGWVNDYNIVKVPGYEANEKSCDGKDNDCNGFTDDGLIPPLSDYQNGVCKGSLKRCAGSYGWVSIIFDLFRISGFEYPTEKSCDGKDNNCDGIPDNISMGPTIIGPDETPLIWPLNDNQKGVCEGSKKICAGATGWANYYSPITIPGYEPEEITCDQKDNDCNPNTPDPCCEIGEAKFKDSYVYPFFPNKAWIDSKVWLNPLPDYDPGPFSKTTLNINLKQPSSTQCTVNLSVEPEIGSGGHNHNLASDGRRTGRLSADHVIFMPNETGYKTVKYTAYTASGIENVRLKVYGQQDKIVPIMVMVPGLQELPSDSTYKLTGTETNKKHLDNHYGTWYVNWNLRRIAIDYLDKTKTKIRINDMSLKWGGVFDIDGNWVEDEHRTHRKGLSADISRYVVVNDKTGELKEIACKKDYKLGEFALDYHGKLICETGDRKHIEFKEE